MADQMAPDGAAAQGGAAPAEEGGGSSSQLAELVSNISSGMSMLSDVLGESGISPEGAQKLEALASEFQSTIEQIMSGAQGGPPQAGGGMVPPEASRGGARPVSPQGMARG